MRPLRVTGYLGSGVTNVYVPLAGLESPSPVPVRDGLGRPPKQAGTPPAVPYTDDTVRLSQVWVAACSRLKLGMKSIGD